MKMIDILDKKYIEKSREQDRQELSQKSETGSGCDDLKSVLCLLNQIQESLQCFDLFLTTVVTVWHILPKETNNPFFLALSNLLKLN